MSNIAREEVLRAMRNGGRPLGKPLTGRATTIAQCTPSLGMVSIWWSRLIQSIIPPNNTASAIFYLRDKVGGEIAEVRNGIVEAVREYAKSNPVSHLFWIDDDVLPISPGCLRELLAHDRDICSGVYFHKMAGLTSEPLIYPKAGEGSDYFRPNEWYEVWGHGMGLTLVKLGVYERMEAELDLPKDKYGRTQFYHTTTDDDLIPVSGTGVIHGGYTEDLWFLNNAAKIGVKPLIDTTKHGFGFHYAREWRCQQCEKKLDSDAKGCNDCKVKGYWADRGYPEEQWAQWISGQPITWHTKEGDVVWD